MYRAAALILAAVVVLFALRLAEEPVQVLRKPDVRPAPDAFETVGTSRTEGRDAASQASDEGEPKIGNFEAPKYVPDYKSLEENLDSRDGAHAVRLLIARDLKSRYSDYDVVSVEFADTDELLFYTDEPVTRDQLAYHGGALIFNTYDGALYLGYIYGPPNMDGYYVRSVD